MDVIKYIEKNGDLTFEEKAMTLIDKLIFSILSYVYYDGTVSSNSSRKKTIAEVGKDFFLVHADREFKNIFHTISYAPKILDIIKDKKRYKDLYLYNDVYIGNQHQQFSALTIEINPNLVFVSFEGTDELISGWKEDCAMTYKRFIPSQVQAIKYLNQHFTFKNCELILGGHSKGGNLALISAMYSNPLIRKKVKEIISFDGPGLKKEQLELNRYKEVKDKYNLYIPDTSVFGLLLKNEEYNVVKTNKIAFFSHDPMTWKIDGDNFKEGKLSNFSKILSTGLDKWSNKYTNEEKKVFFDCLFKTIDKQNIVSLIEVMDNYKLVIKIFKELKTLDPTIKLMAKDIVSIYIKCNKEYLKEKFSKKDKKD